MENQDPSSQRMAQQQQQYSQQNDAQQKRFVHEQNRIDRYIKMERLGEGTYGIVYKCKDSMTGDILALKKIRLEKEDDGVPSTAIREISLLKGIKHPNIVELKEVIYSQDQLYLVFEYLEFDLKKYMRHQGQQPLPKEQAQRFLYQILQALIHLHQHRIFHRDLKPQNLLVDSMGHNIKLADFGLARAFGLPIKTYTHEVVTLWYRCPEILLGQKAYALGVDLWSTGCIFAEMVQRRPLFMGDSEIDQIFKIFKVLGTPGDNNWPDALKLKDFKPSFPKFRGIPMTEHTPTLDELEVDLLSGLVALDPTKRISALQALHHPYFDSMDKSKVEVRGSGANTSASRAFYQQ